MFNPEQPPNGGAEKPEITSSEKAAEMTKQRRKDFGLQDENEMSEEEKEKIEQEISELKKKLDDYDYNSVSPEIKDNWYYVELEVDAGKDRELALTNLQEFLKILEENK